LISVKSKTMKFWDKILYIVIIYSLVTSAYQISTVIWCKNEFLLHMERLVTIFYALEIVLKFMRRLPEHPTCGHGVIAKKYAYSGRLAVNLLVMFPFKELHLLHPKVAQAFKLLRLM